MSNRYAKKIPHYGATEYETQHNAINSLNLTKMTGVFAGSCLHIIKAVYMRSYHSWLGATVYRSQM